MILLAIGRKLDENSARSRKAAKFGLRTKSITKKYNQKYNQKITEDGTKFFPKSII